jgi:hypothetical protein
MTIEERTLSKEIAQQVREKFGKECLNAKEFATYLGRTQEYVAEKIRRRELPGYCIGHSFTIPIDSIAIWIVRLSTTKQLKRE